jgi:pyruvate/2-oxoglutarate dehydrogenase complex dihydrolipoamide acyltransferase (E2) component
VIELLINVGQAVHVDDPLVTLESDTGAVKERGTNREVARHSGAEAAAAESSSGAVVGVR